MDYRFKHCVNVIRFPKPPVIEFRDSKGCYDCKQLVLAHPTNSETWQNDVKGVFVKASEPSDVINFVMKDSSGAIITNYGYTPTFPKDTSARGFVYNWQEVLNNNGIGCYTIEISYTISGVSDSYVYGVYDLKQYSVENSDKTVRVRSKFNSYSQKERIDFTDSDFTDSVRFKGFFGDRAPNTEVRNLIGVNRRVEKTTRENVNTYTLTSDPLLSCVTSLLVDFHFLNEDELFISGHHRYNHVKSYLDFPVSIPESYKLEKLKGSQHAVVSAEFGDRELQCKNYYTRK